MFLLLKPASSWLEFLRRMAKAASLPPTLVDTDFDGIVDIAYAGDRYGNMFRFDLSGETPSEWSAQMISKARVINRLRLRLQSPVAVKTSMSLFLVRVARFIRMN